MTSVKYFSFCMLILTFSPSFNSDFYKCIQCMDIQVLASKLEYCQIVEIFQ